MPYKKNKRRFLIHDSTTLRATRAYVLVAGETFAYHFRRAAMPQQRREMSASAVAAGEPDSLRPGVKRCALALCASGLLCTLHSTPLSLVDGG